MEQRPNPSIESQSPGTPEQFGALLQSESARYAKVVREAGIKAD
jgi:tripartite-type tricarboxylate transporter receptor subunit TctC